MANNLPCQGAGGDNHDLLSGGYLEKKLLTNKIISVFMVGLSTKTFMYNIGTARYSNYFQGVSCNFISI